MHGSKFVAIVPARVPRELKQSNYMQGHASSLAHCIVCSQVRFPVDFTFMNIEPTGQSFQSSPVSQETIDIALKSFSFVDFLLYHIRNQWQSLLGCFN